MNQPTLNSQWLQAHLAALCGDDPPERWLVAVSGGLDSSVLLHLLSQMESGEGAEILAVHVDHGLHADAGDWANHCRELAENLGATCTTVRVDIDTNSGDSVEALARAARYSAIKALVERGDCVLTAHHENDQAETVLLNLLRGSGPAGLAGIGAAQPFGAGRLLRPLLGVSRAALEAYARQQGLEWVDDPGNEALRFDRNFLRNEILPAMAERWPAVTARLARSAVLAGESSALLQQLADLDIAEAGVAERLDCGVLRSLAPARARNLLRRAVARCGLPPAPATRLHQVLDELLPARQDGAPRVHWPGGEIRRFRGRIYLLPAMTAAPAPPSSLLTPSAVLDLGADAGTLSLVPGAARGIDPQRVSAGIEIRYRRGGEEIRPDGHDCTHRLKKLLQQAAIVPWMRERMPLLYANGTLIAVADRWVAAEVSRAGGYCVRWQGHASLE